MRKKAGTGGYGGTLNSGDNLDAGDGINTLELSVFNMNSNGAATTTVTGFTAANLQKIVLKALGAVAGNTTTYDAGATTAGATTAGAEFWSNASTRGVIFDDIQLNATIGLMGGTDQNVTATFKDSLVNGNSDTGTLELNGAGDADTAPGNTVTLRGKTTASAGFTAKLTIAGSTGADEVIVGSGGSVLNATQGSDDYTFGTGNDSLVYTNVNQSLTSVVDDAAILNSIDTITGWGQGADTIDVNGLVLAGPGTLAEVNFIDQATVQAAVDAASPASLKEAAVAAGNFIRWDKISAFQYGGNTYVLGQDNSGVFAATDLFVRIIGEHTLTTDDFIFA